MATCICKVCKHKDYESCSKCTCCRYNKAACMQIVPQQW